MFGIIANLEIKENNEHIKTICNFLSKNKLEYEVATIVQDWFGNYIYNLPNNIDYIIALGGDGTILQAAQNAIKSNAPIIAFNTGTLGFLAEYNIKDYKEVLTQIITNNFFIEKRTMINVFKDNKLIDKCLNDAAICRDGFSRVLTLEIVIDDIVINNYRCDGVVISTPTGSTGYNLSLGGPIMSPRSDNVIVTPIAPHTLMSRPLVLSRNEIVKINICKSRKEQEREAILTCDGRKNIDLHSGDSLIVKSSDEIVNLVKLNKRNIFEVCNEKLK